MQYIGVQRSLGPINSIIFCGVSVGPTKLGNKAGEQSWGKNQFGLLASPPWPLLSRPLLGNEAGEQSWGTKLGNKSTRTPGQPPSPLLSCSLYTIPPKSPLKSRLDGVPGRLGKSQKEGQKNQRTFKSLGAIPPSFFHLSLVLSPFLLTLPWPPQTPSNELKKSPA